MRAEIVIALRFDRYNTDKDYVRVFPVEIPMDLVRSVDYADATADAFISNFICTPRHIIDHVKKERESFVKMVSEGVSEAFMEFLESRDTIMGYPKDKA